MSVIGSNMLAGSSGTVGAYQVERSLRFNSADSAYLNRTPANAGNRKTWTWSGWVKRTKLGTSQNIFLSSTTGNYAYLCFLSNDAINVNTTTSSVSVHDATSTSVYRDVGAWLHLVTAFDSTQATAANRWRVWVNGSAVTMTASTQIGQNVDGQINAAIGHYLGANQVPATLFDGYLAENYFIDGQALDPTSFAETDATTGQWIPKAYTGTYGTNGFYLKFADNSGVTATTLGKDSSSNGNNFTPNNFSVTAGVGNDSLVDSPTNYGTDTGAGGEVRGNYCTINPIAATAIANNSYTLTNGNLDATGTSATYYGFLAGTIEFDSGTTTGFYWEYTQTTYGSAGTHVGIYNSANFGSGMLPANSFMGGATTNTFGVTYRNDGYIGNLGTTTSGFTTWPSAGDVIGVAVKDNKVWFSKNGTWISGNPALGTSPSVTLPSSRMVVPVVGMILNAVGSINFGQRPFAYTAPSGFKALCTQNLPAPAVVQSNTGMDVALWSGNSTDGRVITGLNFQPDFVWIKNRTDLAYWHVLFDSVRGAGNQLASNVTDAELASASNVAGKVSAFNTSGFTLAKGSSATLNGLGSVNGTGNSYVGWTWKANGAGSSNTAGSITSTVSVNTTAGISVVTWTGNNTNGATVGHGLGVAPKLVIVKNRSIAIDWPVYHANLTSGNMLWLNLTSQQYSITVNTNNGGVGAVSSSTFTCTNGTVNGNAVNGSGNSMVAYCFAEVPGFSKFGSYTGNGAADGPFVYCGFRPRFILSKRTDAGTNYWYITDTVRNTTNAVDLALYPNVSNAEGSYVAFDILSNGFKVRNTSTDINASGGTYIFAAFAEMPFNYARAR